MFPYKIMYKLVRVLTINRNLVSRKTRLKSHDTFLEFYFLQEYAKNNILKNLIGKELILL